MVTKTSGVAAPVRITPCALSPTELRSTIVALLAAAEEEKMSAKRVPCHVVLLAFAYQLIACWTSSNCPAGCRSIP
jgi:hypothetical protein